MIVPAALSTAGPTRRAVCAALALALGLACAVLAAAVSTGMSGMSGMSGVSGTNEVAATAASSAATAAETTDVTAMVVAGDAVQQMTSMCDNVCAGVTTGGLCTVAAGILLTGVLALLLASPRNTFLRLLARARPPGLVRRRLRQRTPWLALSPVSLCVFRV